MSEYSLIARIPNKVWRDKIATNDAAFLDFMQIQDVKFDSDDALIEHIKELCRKHAITGIKFGPKRKNKMGEHDEQAAFFEWCEYHKAQYPELAHFYAVPNGGYRTISTARKLKAEGVKAGVLDTHLPIKRGAYIGLWIEFKFGKNCLSPEQEAWAEFLRKAGHRVEVVWNSYEAIAVTLEYLRLDDGIPF